MITQKESIVNKKNENKGDMEMNKNQERVYKALEAISTVIFATEDATEAIHELTEIEVKEVLEAFGQKYYEFEPKEMAGDFFNSHGRTQNIILNLGRKRTR